MLGTLFLITLAVYGLLRLCRLYMTTFVWGKIDPKNEISVKGKVVLITGANAGIGKETAQEMAQRGATVVLACRNEGATLRAIEDIQQKTSNGKLIFKKLDLASLASIRNFANEFKKEFSKLDILICNAGVLTPLSAKAKTEDGFEENLGINHLGHFLLTNCLLEPIKNAAPSRIVILSSMLHNSGEVDFNDLMSVKKSYKDSVFRNPLYANSKLANALFNRELGRRLEGTGVSTYALCPGAVRTNIAKDYNIPKCFNLILPILACFTKTPSEGAQTTLFCSLSKHPDVLNKTGEFYQNCGFWDPKDRIELKEEDAARLWTISEKLVG